MKFKRRYACIIAAVLAVSVFFLVHYKSDKANILEIRDASSGKLYGKWPLPEETESFSIEFVHSVNQSPVRETFAAEGKMIRPMEARFYSFGAGMPGGPGKGQTMSRDGDAIVITGFDDLSKELNYIVGTVSDHLLLIGGQTISLRELCGRNAHITIRIK